LRGQDARATAGETPALPPLATALLTFMWRPRFPPAQLTCKQGRLTFPLKASHAKLSSQASSVVCMDIREAQEKIFKRTSAIERHNPDFEALAKAYGTDYFRISNDQEVDPVLKQAVAPSRRAVRVEARVEYCEPTHYFRAASAAVLGRVPFIQKLGMAGRVLWRML
jgi:thiamine pyrophosphate-dependent enzyme